MTFADWITLGVGIGIGALMIFGLLHSLIIENDDDWKG